MQVSGPIHPQLQRDVLAIERLYGREELAQAVLERLWVDWEDGQVDPVAAVQHLLLLNEVAGSLLHDMAHVADDLNVLIAKDERRDDRNIEQMASRVRRLNEILDALRAVYGRTRPA